MGLCLSHCGEAQHKAVAAAVSISHHEVVSPVRPSRAEGQDPSQSLKRFLHLYKDGSESRKFSTASPRGSLDDSLAIPHSSELFSLPSEGSEWERSRSPSPSRRSITSIGRSSTSSRATPQGKTSTGAQPGRFSTDKPPVVPRDSVRKVPARKSCSSLGHCQAPVEPPHKNLVETIARLEKFCDVKLFLEKRSSFLRSSSHELGLTAHENSILLHDSCRDLAQKLLCFANEHAFHNALVRATDLHADGILSPSIRRCESAKEMYAHSATCVTSHSYAVELKESLPLEKSVASFLEEVENFVSKVEAAAPQRSTGYFTDEEREEGVSRLPSLRIQGTDEKVLFTDFEATFELSSQPTELPCDRSLEAEQPSGHTCNATRDIVVHRAIASESVERGTENSPPIFTCKLAHRHSRATSDVSGLRHIDGNPKISQQEWQSKASVPRSALTDICSNVTPLHPLKPRTITGTKRGVSRSLDLRDFSISPLEFSTFKKRWELSQGTDHSTQGAAATMSSEEEESREGEAADSASIQRIANEEEGNEVSPSSPKERVPGDEVERIQESVCTEDAYISGELPAIPVDVAHLQVTGAGLLNKDSEKSLSMAFDNLLKLLQSPSGELAQNTTELVDLLASQTDARANAELSAAGLQLSEVETGTETQADMPLPCQAESWHDVQASLSTPVIPPARF